MRPIHTLIAVTSVTMLVLPLIAGAQTYVSPEDVLLQHDQAFLIPGHERGAKYWSDLQAQQSLERHQVFVNEPSDPIQDTGIPPPANINAYLPLPVAAVPQQVYNPYGNLDPLTIRLLARLEQQNALLSSTSAASGAPLAQSGPASILAVIAMMIAVGWTLRRARGMGRFM